MLPATFKTREIVYRHRSFRGVELARPDGFSRANRKRSGGSAVVATRRLRTKTSKSTCLGARRRNSLSRTNWSRRTFLLLPRTKSMVRAPPPRRQLSTSTPQPLMIWELMVGMARCADFQVRSHLLAIEAGDQKKKFDKFLYQDNSGN